MRHHRLLTPCAAAAPARASAARRALTALLGALVATGCGPESEAPVAGAAVARIVGGVPSGPEDDAVVLIRYAPPLPYTSGRCTATLIAPNLIVTAFHCLSSTSEGSFGCTRDGALVELDPGAGVVHRLAEPDEILIFPGSCGDLSPVGAGGGGGEDRRCGTEQVEPAARGREIFSTLSYTPCMNDIAFVVLDRSLELPIAPVRLDESMHRGELVTVVGYGGTGLAGDMGRFRREEVRVTDLGEGISEEFAGEVPPLQFALESAACFGDSGGPSLSARGAVMGVSSRLGGTSCTSPLAIDYYSCLAPYAGLAAQAFEAAGAEPWREGTPPPGRGGAGGAAGAAGSGARTAGGGGGLAAGGGGEPGAGEAGALAAGTAGTTRTAPARPRDDDAAGCCQTAAGRTHDAQGAAVLFAVLLLAGARNRRRSRPER